MSTIKHTPGPWVVSQNYSEMWEVNSGDEFPIAKVVNKWRKREVNEANARLIAAAPTMLEALQNYTKVIERFLETMPDNVIVDMISAAVVQDAHSKAKQAIAKATGESLTNQNKNK